MNERNQEPLKSVCFDEFAPTTYEQWKEEAVASLKGADFDKKLLSKTYEGITLEPIYTKESAETFAQRLSFPGADDYLRGVNSGGYLDEPWAIAQKMSICRPAEANAVLKEELASGCTAICLDYDKLCISNVDDLVTLFDGICLEEPELNIFAGASVMPLLGLFKARVSKQGFASHNYRGCVGADPIGVYALEGKSADLDCYYKQMGEAMKWTSDNMSDVRTIFIQGSVYHNAGASAVQELAASMATAIAYIDELLEQGFAINDIAKQIRFRFSLGANFFMEIAKLRAARTIWAQIIKAYNGDEEVCKLNVAANTSAFTSTVYDPYVNILRATSQAFSGVVGGVDAMTVLPFDDAIGESVELSRRVSRNIQIMMQNEFNLLSPVDPAGGSWYIETLTGELAEAAWGELQKIDAAGGIVAVLQSGSLQEEIGAVLKSRFKALSTRMEKAVGSNMYANTTEEPLERQVGCDCTLKPSTPEAVAAMTDLDNSVEKIEAAYLAGANVPDVMGALCCGEAKEITPLAAHRWTEEFEALRAATENHAAKTGNKIKVFLCNMGPIPQHKARAEFSTGFMEVANFEVLKNDGFATTDEAIAAAKASGAEVTVICSTDDTYPELVPVLAKGMKEACPGITILLAGVPAPDMKSIYDEAGVDDYINVKADCLQILSNIQKERGIC